jgi:AcrR family transcriptional regulator
MSEVLIDHRSVRERLLAAADELFYEQGIHTVGIDKVIERAGVAKASLYSTFGSKDELVRAYLQARDDARRARLLAAIDQHTDPTARLLAVFDSLAESVRRPTFRGCAMANASAESDPASAAAEVTLVARHWMLDLLTELATAAGAADPRALATQLALLYDGVNVQARLDSDPARGAAAKAAARTLITAAVGAPGPAPRRGHVTAGGSPRRGR